MAKEQFEDIEIYPAEASEQGCNAFYLDNCEHVGHRPAYAACLKKVDDRKSGRLAPQYSDCSAAIGRKDCRAAKMRKEELAEGRAIYFINRQKMQAFHQERANAEEQKLVGMTSDREAATSANKNRAKASPQTRHPLPEAQKHFLDIKVGGYVDAINAAVDDKPVRDKPQIPVAPIKAGMSLLEMARLQMAAKATV